MATCTPRRTPTPARGPAAARATATAVADTGAAEAIPGSAPGRSCRTIIAGQQQGHRRHAAERHRPAPPAAPTIHQPPGRATRPAPRCGARGRRPAPAAPAPADSDQRAPPPRPAASPSRYGRSGVNLSVTAPPAPAGTSYACCHPSTRTARSRAPPSVAVQPGVEVLRHHEQRRRTRRRRSPAGRSRPTATTLTARGARPARAGSPVAASAPPSPPRMRPTASVRSRCSPAAQRHRLAGEVVAHGDRQRPPGPDVGERAGHRRRVGDAVQRRRTARTPHGAASGVQADAGVTAAAAPRPRRRRPGPASRCRAGRRSAGADPVTTTASRSVVTAGKPHPPVRADVGGDLPGGRAHAAPRRGRAATGEAGATSRSRSTVRAPTTQASRSVGRSSTGSASHAVAGSPSTARVTHRPRRHRSAPTTPTPSPARSSGSARAGPGQRGQPQVVRRVHRRR